MRASSQRCLPIAYVHSSLCKLYSILSKAGIKYSPLTFFWGWPHKSLLSKNGRKWGSLWVVASYRCTEELHFFGQKKNHGDLTQGLIEFLMLHNCFWLQTERLHLHTSGNQHAMREWLQWISHCDDLSLYFSSTQHISTEQQPPRREQ